MVYILHITFISIYYYAPKTFDWILNRIDFLSNEILIRIIGVNKRTVHLPCEVTIIETRHIRKE